MLNLMGETLVNFLDAATAWAWKMFEKDMAMTESILHRTEALLVTIESRVSPALRRFFPNNDR
jgi:hypothetical protein